MCQLSIRRPPWSVAERKGSTPWRAITVAHHGAETTAASGGGEGQVRPCPVRGGMRAMIAEGDREEGRGLEVGKERESGEAPGQGDAKARAAAFEQEPCFAGGEEGEGEAECARQAAAHQEPGERPRARAPSERRGEGGEPAGQEHAAPASRTPRRGARSRRGGGRGRPSRSPPARKGSASGSEVEGEGRVGEGDLAAVVRREGGEREVGATNVGGHGHEQAAVVQRERALEDVGGADGHGEGEDCGEGHRPTGAGPRRALAAPAGDKANGSRSKPSGTPRRTPRDGITATVS